MRKSTQARLGSWQPTSEADVTTKQVVELQYSQGKPVADVQVTSMKAVVTNLAISVHFSRWWMLSRLLVLTNSC